MKKLIVLALALLMLAGTSACGDVADTINDFIEGNVTGEVGKEYKSAWFTFQINSLDTMESYAGLDADEGFVFLVANVYEKNTWNSETAADNPIPMSAGDFFVLQGEDTERTRPEYPWDEGMMPAEFYLEPDEEATYDVVFMIPEDVSDVSFVYEEMDTTKEVHATFTIKHTL